MPALLLIVLFLLTSCNSHPVQTPTASRSQASSENRNTSSEVKQDEDTPYPPAIIRGAHRRSLESLHVGETYEIDVYLPDADLAEDQKLPVLYVLDAEYNYGAVVYLARRLMKHGDLPSVMVVGIAYDTDYDTFYARRSRDLTPTESDNPHGWPSGGADRFARFLTDELFPFIESQYPASSTDRTIMGHSYGGLFTIYALVNMPGVFYRHLAASPSIWYDNQAILADVNAWIVGPERAPARLYVTGGSIEQTIARDVQAIGNALTSADLPELEYQAVVEQGEHHRSIVLIAYTRGLRFLFGD